MWHYCGAPNKTKPGDCGRRLVNHEHCADHRESTVARPLSSSTPTPPHREHPETSATLLADVLADGVDQVLATRVTAYLGTGRGPLRGKRWNAAACRKLAETAQAILELEKKAHEVVGDAVAAILPPRASRFHRELTGAIAEKVTLPGGEELKAIARGMQVIGIFQCLVIKRLPASSCPCLQMSGRAMAEHEMKAHIEGLLQQTEQDLLGRSEEH